MFSKREAMWDNLDFLKFFGEFFKFVQDKNTINYFFKSFGHFLAIHELKFKVI